MRIRAPLEEKQYLVRVRKKPMSTAIVPTFDVLPKPIPRKHSLSLFSDIFVLVGMLPHATPRAQATPVDIYIYIFFEQRRHIAPSQAVCVFWASSNAQAARTFSAASASVCACRLSSSPAFCEIFTRIARLDCVSSIASPELLRKSYYKGLRSTDNPRVLDTLIAPTSCLHNVSRLKVVRGLREKANLLRCS
jgi:hypothetical protein